jgi:hypothetical protein
MYAISYRFSTPQMAHHLPRVSTVLALRRKHHIANLSCLCRFRRNPNTVETLTVYVAIRNEWTNFS